MAHHVRAGVRGGDDPDDARAHRRVGGRVDDDEAAGGAVRRVVVDQQRLGAAERHPAHLVELEHRRRLVAVQTVDVEPVVQGLRRGPHRPGAVLEQVGAPFGQGGALVHPAHGRLDLVRHRRPVVGPAEDVAPGDGDVVVQRDDDRHGRERLGHLAVRRGDGVDPRGRARGHDEHVVPRPQDPAGHRARVAPEVRVLGGLAPDDVLHREAGVDEVLVAADVDRLQVVQQRRAVVPPHVLRALHDVVTAEGRDRNERDVVHVQPGGELHEVGLDLLVAPLVPVDQVHLVDAHDHVGHAEHGGEEGVPARLLDHPLAGVDQDEGHVRVGCAGHHVARVLGVPGGVGDDELALGRGEVAVGHVDRDALFPLGPQPVGQQRQVRLDAAPLLAGAADRLELVLEDPLGVVEEAADQRGLAVVDRAGRGQAQELRH